jgi:hypothetical protein
MLHKRFRIFLNYFLGPVLFIWLMLAIYHQVQQQKSLYSTWMHMLQAFSYKDWLLLVLVVLMMFVNWGLEARKWQIQMRVIEPVSFLRSFRAVFSGQAFGFGSLNGVGEYAGRALYMHEGNRLRSIAVTMVGSLSQLIATFVMGLLGLFYLRYFFPMHQNILHGLSVFWFDALIWVVCIFSAFFILLYFGLAWVTKMFEKIPFVSKYSFFIQKVEELNTAELTRILYLSFVRYFVFMMQYLLLLKIFKINISFLPTSGLICVLFLVLTIIPTVTLAELGIRGELSIQLFGLISSNTIGILFTASGIWFINRVIPALAGSLFILGIRLFKK